MGVRTSTYLFFFWGGGRGREHNSAPNNISQMSGRALRQQELMVSALRCCSGVAGQEHGVCISARRAEAAQDCGCRKAGLQGAGAPPCGSDVGCGGRGCRGVPVRGATLLAPLLPFFTEGAPSVILPLQQVRREEGT